MNRTTGYWIATGLFCLAFTGGGFMHLIRAEQMAEGMAHLGYPPYVMTILGACKLLGVAALLAPGMALLKEWAYAGFAFNLIGATASHLFVGDPVSEWVGPVVLLGVASVSYALRPDDRRLVAAPVTSAEPA